MNSDLMFSSKSNEWATPQDFFDKLDAEFHFTLDPSCTHDNAKCKKHYTIADDGLSKDWTGETVFCNPPYGRQIHKWVEKAYAESQNNVTTVMLLPCRTDTSYFHDYILPYAEVRFIRGRLKFGGSMSPAPFPSMVAIFYGKKG